MSIRNNKIMCVCTIWRIHWLLPQIPLYGLLFTWKIPRLLSRLKWVAIVCAHQLLNAVFCFTSKCLWNSAKRRIAVRRFTLISVPLRILQYLATILRPLSSLHLKVKEKWNVIQTLRTYPAWRVSKYPSVTEHFRLSILTLQDTAPNSFTPENSFRTPVWKTRKLKLPGFHVLLMYFAIDDWVLGLEAEYWIWSRDFIISGNGQWIFWNETSGIINIQFLL